MKLYATITSERATKGQGGEWLDINIKESRKVTFAVIKVRKEAGLFMPVIYIESIGKVVENHCVPCQLCGGKRDVEAIICSKCEPKANNQKDKCELCKNVDCKNHECIPY